jgi:hypothetical protein
MSRALEELSASLVDLEADLAFVSLAARLRPRLGDVVNWSAKGDAVDLAREFMSAKGARVEGVFGPLLVRLLAGVERYTRRLVEEVVALHAGGASIYDQLHAKIKSRNTVLTGNLLVFSESPREHLEFHIESLVRNLASCHAGSTAYRLNAEAFAAAVVGASPVAIERALENVGVSSCWDKVGADNVLAQVLGTKGPRATGKQARGRLEELWRWRNHLAHGGDEEVALTEEQLRECLAFVRAFSAALDGMALKSVHSGTS